MRALLFHPWGRFAECCGASYTALAQRDYLRTRGWDVHCVMQEIPAWGVTATEGDRTIALDCPPVAPRHYGEEFCLLLYASERAAHRRAFRDIAREPWDAFFTTDVCAAPFAHVLSRTVLKALAVGDSYARRAATAEQTPLAVRRAEQKLAFGRVEAELYRVFDRVLFISEADAITARKHGVKSARHVPHAVITGQETGATKTIGEHDITICGGAHSGDIADLEWFYRHVYLPHLRTCGVRLTIAGPVAARFGVNDLRVTKLLSDTGAYEESRIVVVPAHEAAGPHVPALNALAAGRAVIATPLALSGLDIPGNAAIAIDMRSDPLGTANAIRELLASTALRSALGKRAANITNHHSRERYFAALDAIWNSVARPTRARETAEAA